MRRLPTFRTILQFSARVGTFGLAGFVLFGTFACADKPVPPAAAPIAQGVLRCPTPSLETLGQAQNTGEEVIAASCNQEKVHLLCTGSCQLASDACAANLGLPEPTPAPLDGTWSCANEHGIGYTAILRTSGSDVIGTATDIRGRSWAVRGSLRKPGQFREGDSTYSLRAGGRVMEGAMVEVLKSYSTVPPHVRCSRITCTR